jgi:hypothetical protein
LNRFIDRGALVAGWVGIGVAVVLVIALGLVIAIPALVTLAALPVGAVVGAYANVRAQRIRPRWRLIANAVWAGLITGIALAVFYAGVRLIFLYADTGRLPDDTQLNCRTGPDCVYARYVAQGYGPRLAEDGIVDGATYEAAALGELLITGWFLVGLTAAGAAAAGAIQTVTRREPASGAEVAG